ncbi:hypothetical protein [Amycolatopsis sp. cmx-11-12]|uniref:hypothetical protein n=1 Tax=Amycolatopsis sp. cmx-11-12 TaxID=2785795 RepID=UPI003917C227
MKVAVARWSPLAAAPTNSSRVVALPRKSITCPAGTTLSGGRGRPDERRIRNLRRPAADESRGRQRLPRIAVSGGVKFAAPVSPSSETPTLPHAAVRLLLGVTRTVTGTSW